MSGRYLTDLADVCRRAGLNVTEVGSSPGTVGDAWKSRARSSGGYASGRPTHVMVHHTASGPGSDGWPDVNYCTFSNDNRPVANLYLARSGAVWVMAGGATNTNGQGHDSWGGGVPDDSMNTYAIGIEAGNGGTGEPWPMAQQNAYLVLCRALCDAYDIATAHVREHAEWAPGRKIDPAGPSQWTPSGTWPGGPFRGSVAGGSVPITGGDTGMLIIFIITDAAVPYATYVTNGMSYRHVPDQASLDALKLFMAMSGLDSDTNQIGRAQVGMAGIYVGDDGTFGDANPYL